MTEVDLESKLQELLVENPGLTAHQLGALLGIYKGDVNSCLYNSPKFTKIVNEGSARPIWFAAAKETKSDIARGTTQPKAARKTSDASFQKKKTRNDFDFSSLRP